MVESQFSQSFVTILEVVAKDNVIFVFCCILCAWGIFRDLQEHCFVSGVSRSCWNIWWQPTVQVGGWPIGIWVSGLNWEKAGDSRDGGNFRWSRYYKFFSRDWRIYKNRIVFFSERSIKCFTPFIIFSFEIWLSIQDHFFNSLFWLSSQNELFCFFFCNTSSTGRSI